MGKIKKEYIKENKKIKYPIPAKYKKEYTYYDRDINVNKNILAEGLRIREIV